MLKKISAPLAGLALALCVAGAWAAPDVNKASQAELEAVQGIGPSTATHILDERKKGAFKDWDDLITRVKGVGDHNAAKFSTAGLTVNGAEFKGAAAPAHAKPAGKAGTGSTTAPAK